MGAVAFSDLRLVLVVPDHDYAVGGLVVYDPHDVVPVTHVEGGVDNVGVVVDDVPSEVVEDVPNAVGGGDVPNAVGDVPNAVVVEGDVPNVVGVDDASKLHVVADGAPNDVEEVVDDAPNPAVDDTPNLHDVTDSLNPHLLLVMEDALDFHLAMAIVFDLLVMITVAVSVLHRFVTKMAEFPYDLVMLEIMVIQLFQWMSVGLMHLLAFGELSRFLHSCLQV